MINLIGYVLLTTFSSVLAMPRYHFPLAGVTFTSYITKIKKRKKNKKSTKETELTESFPMLTASAILS